VVAGGGTVVDGVATVGGVEEDVEEADTVVKRCVVDAWLVSLTGVGCVDPLEPLHAEANSVTATPVAAIVEVIRTIQLPSGFTADDLDGTNGPASGSPSVGERTARTATGRFIPARGLPYR
jgi:hypothetical protein